MKQCVGILAFLAVSLASSVPQSPHVIAQSSYASTSANPVNIIIANATEPAYTTNIEQNNTESTRRDDIDMSLTGRECNHTIEQNTTDAITQKSAIEVMNETQHSISQRQTKTELPKALLTDIETKYSKNWHGLKEENMQHGSFSIKHDSEQDIFSKYGASEGKITSCKFWEMLWELHPEIEERTEKLSNPVFSEAEILSKIEKRPAISKYVENQRRNEVDRPEIKTLPYVQKQTEIKYSPAVDIHLEAERGPKLERLLKVIRQKAEKPRNMVKLTKLQKRTEVDRFQGIHRLSEMEEALPKARRFLKIEKHPYVNILRGEADVLLKVSRPHEMHRFEEVELNLEINELPEAERLPEIQTVRDFKSIPESVRIQLHPIVVRLNLIIA